MLKISKNIHLYKVVLLSFFLILCSLTFCNSEDKLDKRPLEWAETVKKDSLKNMYKVTDNFYRSAQPSAAGMSELKKMGIKTIINLRRHHTDKDELSGIDIESIHIPINTWHMKDKYVIEFLKIATDPTKQPILLHCKHGSDRTGTMCAMYRIVIQNWNKDDAIKEMQKGGFGYHKIWKNLIKYIKNADIEQIKKSIK
jgi:protein tyrosine/serine phosphatase